MMSKKKGITIEKHNKITMRDFSQLCKHLKVTEKFLSVIANIEIREGKEILSDSESMRLLRIKEIYKKGFEAFQDNDFALEWLKKPYWLMNDIAPLYCAQTEDGFEELIYILNLIEKGAFKFSLPV